MEIEQLLKELNIRYEGSYNEEQDYIIDLPNSEIFGDIFTILNNSNLVNMLDDNQVVTEEGSSLLYEVIDKPYIINLLADWQGDQYRLVINNIE